MQQVAKVALELGGKSANVLLPDADFAKAVRDGVGKAFLNSGQTCWALTRMLVPRDRPSETEELAARSAERMTPGDPFAASSKLGPVASRPQWDRVQGYVQKGIDEGAKLVTGGPGKPDGLDRGLYVKPTVFSDVRRDVTIAQEEIFGPVLAILPYDDEAEAVEIANDSRYGLAGGVWAGTPERAEAVARQLQTGQVEINGGAFNPDAPFGGYKQSGIGREAGRFGLDEFLEVKSLQR
jgi:acyl-CoA reductase-like NAD-dependent aldehyde dehydrogenase